MDDQKYIIQEQQYFNSKIYRFVRERRGNRQLSLFGQPFGPYLYRNLLNNQLFACWTMPNKDIRVLYTGEYIGINVNALKYYKNY